MAFGADALKSADPIIIGEFASLSGDKATYGINSNRGVELAIEEINSQGGLLNHRPLKLLSEDDQSKAGQPAAIVRKLISNDHAVAILGEFASSLSLEAAPICQASRIPMVSPGSTIPNLTDKGDYIFRMCFIDPFQGLVMAKFALENLKIHRAAILTTVNQDYSVGLSEAFKEYFTKQGGVIVSEKSCTSGDKDFRAQLTAIKSTNPEAIFVPAYYGDVSLIARQARSLGITVPLLGGDGWDSPKLHDLAGSSMEGCYFSTHFSTQDQNPDIQKFIADYKTKFHDEPDTTSALGYDTVLFIADAIQRAGTTEPAPLRDAMATTKNLKILTGHLTIDEHRNPKKNAVVMRVKDKAFTYVTTIEP